MASLSDLPSPVRLAAFCGGLVLVFAVALGVGAATGDVAPASSAPAPSAGGHGGAHEDGDAGTASHDGGHSDGRSAGADGGHDGDHTAPAGAALGTVLDDGTLRLDVGTTVLAAGERTPFTFRVLDGEGRAVTEFDLEQERRMHLVLVDRDLSRFAHLHPELDASGTWTQDLTPDPGSYRAVLDFVVDGQRHVLGTDVTVPGPLQARALPEPAASTTVDGYDVALRRDGERFSFEVTRDGEPVELEPYLGAQGHLVSLRAGDLAYAHAHTGTDGSYAVDLAPGTWRLFLQFSADGAVRTAPFTVEV